MFTEADTNAVRSTCIGGPKTPIVFVTIIVSRPALEVCHINIQNPTALTFLLMFKVDYCPERSCEGADTFTLFQSFVQTRPRPLCVETG